jgi:hypothetical protein
MRDDRDFFEADFTQYDPIRIVRPPERLLTRGRLIFAALLAVGLIAMVVGALLGGVL